jgi:hypothetical protein
MWHDICKAASYHAIPSPPTPFQMVLKNTKLQKYYKPVIYSTRQYTFLFYIIIYQIYFCSFKIKCKTKIYLLPNSCIKLGCNKYGSDTKHGKCSIL